MNHCKLKSAAPSLLAALLVMGPGVPARAQNVDVPASIVTRDVPALPASVAQRLAKYANVRSAYLAGWQDDSLLVYTRFADSVQLHRVREPLGYREQLTFLKEPVAGAIVPARGAKDKLMLMWDVGGSEFDQLYLFDLKSRTSKLVSDGRSLYANVIWSPDEQRFVYVTTERNGRNWDIHIQDLQGNKQVVFESESGYWLPLDWSADGQRLLIRNRVSINESSVYELDIASRELRPLLGTQERMSVSNARYDANGDVIFTADDRGEFLRLQRLDTSTGNVDVITEDVAWDVEAFALSPDRDRVAFSVNANGTSKLSIWNAQTNKVSRLSDVPSGSISGMRFSPEGQRLAVTINRATSPADVYVVGLRRGKVHRWTRSEVGGLDAGRFVEPELISYPTFDGHDIPAFVYRPATAGPHPVVISIHGGPEGQYRPRFSTTVQSYVNEMGVVFIAPNVRGSAGYGKTYLTLDNGYLREDSVKDIGALLDWVAGQDELDSDRVAVMGGSYGGYMVLASVVHFGDRLAAAVESVGISNFVTFLQNTQAYRQDIRRVEYGDERDAKMRAFLQSISPLNHVERMQTPLLISQGANDPRVPASESDQIKQALDQAGVPAWYILATDEGHGFRKKVNRDYDQAAKFAFLESYLQAEQ